MSPSPPVLDPPLNAPLNAFAPATEDAWRALVDKVLKGAPFEKLVARTYDGLAIAPLYPRAAADQARPLRAGTGAWQILARVDHPDAASANAQALDDLRQGATGLHLVFKGAVGAYGFGLADASAESLARLFDGVHLDAGIGLEIDPGDAAQEVAIHLAALIDAHKIPPAAVQVNFGFDPLGQLAASGLSPAPWPQVSASFARTIADLFGFGFTGPLCTVDARVVHAAGGSEAQELAYALGCGIACLRAFEAAGIPLDSARGLLGFRMAADADEFLGIAKFRALRLLWARVEDVCGLTPKPLHLHVETAWRMMTRRDPWVNLLRGTIATFSAALGGADAISVLPSTQALGLPAPFARRIARNTQLVLLEESNLDKVADPAAGAGGFEALTHDLCDAAWTLFQAQEKAGGLVAALQSGSFQGAVATVRAERQKNIGRRRDPLTGVSEFPDIGETPVEVLRPLGTDAGVTPPGSGAPFCEPLRMIRLATPFEALRDVADTRSPRPRVFLANLGPVSAFSARAGFAKNLFEAGGLEAPGNDGFDSADAVAAAYAQSGAQLACLCSSDTLYAERAIDTVKALVAAGARHIYFAGRPGALEAALNEAGVAEFIFAGGDVLATLAGALRRAT